MSYTYNKPSIVSAPVAVTRVLGTAYQPSLTNSVSVSVTVSVPGGDGDTADDIVIEVSPDGSTGWVIVDEAYMDFDVGGLLGVSGQANARQGMQGDVPAGYWYRIRRVSGTGSIIRTIESTWL